MIALRFPNGTRVVYNAATTIRVEGQVIWVMNKEGGWYACVPMASGAIVEGVPACSVTTPESEKLSALKYTVEHRLTLLSRKIGQLSNGHAKKRLKAVTPR